MPQKPSKKRGRPSQGLSESLVVHVSPESKGWLQELVRESGIREGELVRRIINVARSRNWSPS